MQFLIVIGACIAGLLISIGGDDTDLALGFCTGLALGIAFVRLNAQAARIAALQRELATLRSAPIERDRDAHAGAPGDADAPMPLIP
ncbi:MAG: hypothetical protein F9K31_14250, partial [Dokdonella sp.]